MEYKGKFKYYVVEFLELPSNKINIGKYVCVPCTWIAARRKKDQKVIVSYPTENKSDTVKRVKRRQKRSIEWKCYLADVKYATDLYEDAEIFIKGKMNDYECSNINNRGQKTILAKKNTGRSKRNSKSNNEAIESLNSIIPTKNNDKFENKQMAVPSPDTDAALVQSKVVETECSGVAAEPSNQPPECSYDPQYFPTCADFPSQSSYPSEISVENSNDRSNNEELVHAENITQGSSVIQNFSNSTNSQPNLNQIPTTYFTDLLEVLRDQHTVSVRSLAMVDQLSKIINQNTELMKDVKQLLVNISSSNNDIPPTSSTNTTAEVEKISIKRKRKVTPQNEEHDDYSNDDNSDDVPQKRLSQRRKFVLPPEYDENDSRWTLKYREPAPGLVELMPHTNVYINAMKLSNCKRLSRDCKMLARMLLVEIFTKNALTICSLTGSRAKAYDVEGASIRPGLDENARTVLLSYVEEYGREKNWITHDSTSIANSIRNKMQEFRFKYG